MEVFQTLLQQDPFTETKFTNELNLLNDKSEPALIEKSAGIPSFTNCLLVYPPIQITNH